MNKCDFTFDHLDSEYEDYWFNVSGNSQDELTDKYMEQSMIAVTSVVFSVKENFLGVKRLFPFNYDVITVKDDELYHILQLLIAEQKSN